MGTGRVAAFSDGVIAIIITIMVLELKVPHDTSTSALLHLAPLFLSYLMSFLIVAIMWVNHHHLLHTALRADASLLWTNNLLLFWMSLIPFVTGYMGENHTAPLAVAMYGGLLALGSAAFGLLRLSVARPHRHDPSLTGYHGRAHRKNITTFALYVAAVPLGYVSIWLSYAIFPMIPLAYFIPEHRAAAGE
ncbi:MAG: TMEM175 family protein [Gemmatimonadota bacterium]|mgnify:CR=1 FL=1|nr:TMEM175 family protein [Gemmatimonadota bacterium]